MQAINQRGPQEPSAECRENQAHPVPSAWQGDACRQFDEEMEKRMGGQYDKARALFSKTERAKGRIEDIHWDGRTPTEAETREENKLQVGIDEAESWLHQNVYLNPVIKKLMYPTVKNRSISFDDDNLAYLREMEAVHGVEAGELRASQDSLRGMIKYYGKSWELFLREVGDKAEYTGTEVQNWLEC